MTMEAFMSKLRFFALRSLALALVVFCAALPGLAEKKPTQMVKPMAGPRATAPPGQGAPAPADPTRAAGPWSDCMLGAVPPSASESACLRITKHEPKR